MTLALSQGQMFFIPQEKVKAAKSTLQQKNGYLKKHGLTPKFIRDKKSGGVYVWAIPTPWTDQ